MAGVRFQVDDVDNSARVDTDMMAASSTSASNASSAQKAMWETEIETYIASVKTLMSEVDQSETNADDVLEIMSRRIDLASAIKVDPFSPSSWDTLLSFESEMIKAKTLKGEPNSSHANSAVLSPILFRLYQVATRIIPKTRSNARDENYVNIWLGFTRLQSTMGCLDDARDTIKCLKGARIGERMAKLYTTWAELEMESGHLEKALAVLGKGIQNKAEPQQEIILLRQRYERSSTKGAESGSVKNETIVVSDTPQTPVIVDHTNLVSNLSSTASQKVDRFEHSFKSRNNIVNPSTPKDSNHHLPHDLKAERDTPFPYSSNYRQDQISSTSQLSEHKYNNRPYTTTMTMTANSKDGRTPATTTERSMVGSCSGSTHGSSAKGDLETDLVDSSNSTKDRPGTEQSCKRNYMIKGQKLKSSGLSSGLLSKIGGPARRVASDAEENFTSALDEIDTTHLSRITEGSSQENPSSSGSGAESEGSEVTSKRTPAKVLGGDRDQLSTKIETTECKQTPILTKSTQKIFRSTPGQKMTPRQQVRRQIDINIAGKLLHESTSLQIKKDHTKPVEGTRQNLPLKKDLLQNENLEVKNDKLENAAEVKVKSTQEEMTKRGILQKKQSERDTSRSGIVRDQVVDGSKKSVENMNGSTSQCHGDRLVENNNRRVKRIREDDNTVVVNSTRYVKLECVGKGGSSKVFKVMAPNKKIYALKRIRLSGRESSSAAGFLEEITLLKRLKGRDNIIQLIDSEYVQSEGLIYMILECGEIDLARMLARKEKAKSSEKDNSIDENFIRLYWQQMLEAVAAIHEERIVHSDLKPANFLFVEGTLKLIDFGIAKTIQNDTTNIVRDSQVGTLNYMSPEAILGSEGKHKLGRASDVWSLGCILYQMVYGTTPFASLPFIQKLHAITDDKHKISFPRCANMYIDEVMKRCLDRSPRTRVSIPELLQHPFLHPEAAPSPAPTSRQPDSISMDQLQAILMQVSGNADNVESITKEAMRQIKTGKSLDLTHILPQDRKSTSISCGSDESTTSFDSVKRPINAPLPAPPPPPPPPPPQFSLSASSSAECSESQNPLPAPRLRLVAASNCDSHDIVSALASRPPLRSLSLPTTVDSKENIAPPVGKMNHFTLAQECANRVQSLKPVKSMTSKPLQGHIPPDLHDEILKKHNNLRHVSPAPRSFEKVTNNPLQNMIEKGLAKFHIPADADVVGDGTTHDWD